MCEEEKNDKRIYSNRVDIVSSVYDVILKFSVAVPRKDEAGKTVEELSHQIDVYMSPQHAKVFAKVILEQIQGYESVHGEMKVGPAQQNKQ